MDVFRSEKQKAFESAKTSILALSSLLLDSLKQLNSAGNSNDRDKMKKTQFSHFMEFALWGNKTDLSLHPTATNKEEVLKSLQSSELSELDTLRESILVNDMERVYEYLSQLVQQQQQQQQSTSSIRIDIILDNAGYELFTDLILAEWLTSAGFATDIHFHVKEYGWYVSDVTEFDLLWTVQQLSASEDPVVKELGERWKNERLPSCYTAGGEFISSSLVNSNSNSSGSGSKQGKWFIEKHEYWTLPGDYQELVHLAPDLYERLKSPQLLIFKGDLNYRRLIGDREWSSTTLFTTALGEFRPAPIVTLRTLKAEVVVGLGEGVESKVSSIDSSWLSNGKWALISYAP